MSDRYGGTSSNYDEGNIRYYSRYYSVDPDDYIDEDTYVYASPDNYIYFNCSDYDNQSSSTCETWRIIGIVDGKVKLIRNDSIGEYEWDSDDVTNNWSTSTLNTYLNEDYYNSLNTKNSKTTELISPSIYYLGGYSDSSVYSDQLYIYERTNSVGTTVLSGNPFTVETNIGLMYGSDHGYATNFSICNSSLNNYTDSGCGDYHWMPAEHWLITPDTSSSQYAWMVNYNGDLSSEPIGGADYGVGQAGWVYPVLYLDTSVMIKDGDGTSGNPYQLKVS